MLPPILQVGPLPLDENAGGALDELAPP